MVLVFPHHLDPHHLDLYLAGFSFWFIFQYKRQLFKEIFVSTQPKIRTLSFCIIPVCLKSAEYLCWLIFCLPSSLFIECKLYESQNLLILFIDTSSAPKVELGTGIHIHFLNEWINKLDNFRALKRSTYKKKILPLI